jgi:uncharacterized protein with von Willebrand factor type A (vWA) domain
VPKDNDDVFGALIPDRIPDWLVNQVRRMEGRNMDEFKGLEDYFKETEIIKADRYDRRFYKGMTDKAPELKDTANKRFVDDPTWAELIQDEFLGLFKADPDFRKDKDMKPTHLLNHAALSKAKDLKDWEQLRTYTTVDEWAATMATVEFALKLGEIFDELKELMEAQKKMQDEDQKIRDLIEQLNEMGPDGEEDAANDLLDQLRDALGNYKQAVQDLKDQIGKNQNEIRQAVRDATRDAKDDAENLNETLESFGTEPGALQRMPAEARLKLARRIQGNRKLKELADKVGRFVRLALGEQARKIIHGTDEVHDVTMGSDLTRTLPSEWIGLADENLELTFLIRYIENTLLEYELRGTEKVARGAIICMIDSSGSMGGSKETWAKAVGIALLNIAKRQNRDFYGIIFGSAHELMEFDFPKGNASHDKVLDFAEFAYMGGTDFMAPISKAVKVLERQFNDAGSQKGDLVLITDGICAVSDDWLKKYFNSKEALAFRFYSCLIGVNAPILEVLSDTIYNITELAQGDDAKEIFGFV